MHMKMKIVQTGLFTGLGYIGYFKSGYMKSLLLDKLTK